MRSYVLVKYARHVIIKIINWQVLVEVLRVKEVRHRFADNKLLDKAFVSKSDKNIMGSEHTNMILLYIIYTAESIHP